MKLRLALSACLAAAAAGSVAAAPAGASQIVDRNATGVSLEVDRTGQTALVSYHKKRGGARNVLFWGATDWDDEFKVDYSGGWGSQRKDVWKTFKDACRPYTGPRLELMVAACDAPDGSHWALQRWQRLWNNYGGDRAAEELHLSHWTGDIGDLVIKTDWGYHGMWRHIYGWFTYHDAPVFGDKHTEAGVPLDKKGRNVYVDYRDGSWKRENSFLTHPETAAFCYLFSRHDGRVGDGDAYRATVIGPGVTPIVRTSFDSPAVDAYDEAVDAAANDEQTQLFEDDTRAGTKIPRCKIN